MRRVLTQFNRPQVVTSHVLLSRYWRYCGRCRLGMARWKLRDEPRPALNLARIRRGRRDVLLHGFTNSPPQSQLRPTALTGLDVPLNALALVRVAPASGVFWKALDALSAGDINAHRFVLSRRAAPGAWGSSEAASAFASARRA